MCSPLPRTRFHHTRITHTFPRPDSPLSHFTFPSFHCVHMPFTVGCLASPRPLPTSTFVRPFSSPRPFPSSIIRFSDCFLPSIIRLTISGVCHTVPGATPPAPPTPPPPLPESGGPGVNAAPRGGIWVRGDRIAGSGKPSPPPPRGPRGPRGARVARGEGSSISASALIDTFRWIWDTSSCVSSGIPIASSLFFTRSTDSLFNTWRRTEGSGG